VAQGVDGTSWRANLPTRQDDHRPLVAPAHTDGTTHRATIDALHTDSSS